MAAQQRSIFVARIVAALAGLFCASGALAATPINDLGSGLYLGQYQGGLYPNGSNAIPAQHSAAGLSHAGVVAQRDVAGASALAGTRLAWAGRMPSNTPSVA